jgi:hypothetical protein
VESHPFGFAQGRLFDSAGRACLPRSAQDDNSVESEVLRFAQDDNSVESEVLRFAQDDNSVESEVLRFRSG